MPLCRYDDDAIARARQGALEWLEGNRDGYPRSWEQEKLNDKRRGYIMYDEDEAPPIAGYDALERENIADRLGEVKERGETRVHFRLKKQ